MGAAEKKQLQKDIADFQMYQVKCHEKEKAQEVADGLAEKAKIQEALKEHLENTKMEGQGKIEAQRRYRESLYEQQAKIQEKARLERHMCEEEDKERRVTSLAGRQLTCKRLAKVKEIKKEKDAVKDALYDKLTKYFIEKGDNHDELIRLAREAEDARIKEEEDAKAAKRKKATDEMLQHLEMTMKEHEDRVRGAEMAEAAAIFAKGEVAKIQVRKEEA